MRAFVKLPRQRPTLAQAIQALPSALQRFTAVFGMGTGGTTAAKPPGNQGQKSEYRIQESEQPSQSSEPYSEFWLLTPGFCRFERTVFSDNCIQQAGPQRLRLLNHFLQALGLPPSVPSLWLVADAEDVALENLSDQASRLISTGQLTCCHVYTPGLSTG